MASPSVYVIATKHERYAGETFPEGSVVIDPWRYIPAQKGVTVKRIGENKPTLISLLVPTRGRPADFLRLVKSAYDLATHRHRIEVVAYLDDDDEKNYQPRLLGVKYIVGPRILLSECWNRCYDEANGDIVMHCGDDIVFKTSGWDTVVRRAFAESKDKLILVHGDDVSPNTDALATHGFLHRRWIETVGYFLPPLFSCDWNDVWLTEIADLVDRRVKVPIVTEHMHYSFDKRERDGTDEDREERGRRDDVVTLFKNTAKMRKLDAAKLQAAMS